jgi:protein-disulfide isomerase
VTYKRSLNVFAALTAASLLLASCGDSSSVLSEGSATAGGGAGGGSNVVLKESDRMMGSPDAPVTVIEYASMTCPHCAAFATGVFPQLKSEYIDPGQVKFVFREFPLDGVARVASALARCQTGDNYFAFIDLIFHNQQEWLSGLFGTGQEMTQELVEESLIDYARQAGLGRDQAIACMRDPQNLAEVDENWGEAQNQYNINATPGFVINGTTHSGAMPIETFREILDPLL